MTQSNMCVLHNTLCKDNFPADEKNSNSGSETSVGNPILKRNDEVFKLVLGNEHLGIRLEAGYDGGKDGGSDGGPGGGGLGFCLKFLLALRMRDRAAITLEKLWALVKRLVIRLVRGLTGSVTILLIVVSEDEDNKKDTHIFVGQESSG